MNNQLCFDLGMDLAQALAANLKQRRGKLTQESFARKLGISQSTLARLERCEQNATLQTLAQISKALKCEVEDLFK